VSATAEPARPRASASPFVRRLGAPVDRLIGAYAVISGGALLFAHRPASWPLLAVLHLAAALIGFGAPPAAWLWSRLAARAPRVAELLAGWYPLLLVPALYSELAVLNQAVFGGAYFDSLVIGWEQWLFGGQPSREWAVAAPWLWLSEPLHAAYLAYYPLIYGPPLGLWLAGRRSDFEICVFTLMLVFFAHYVFFIYFPVQGPRYLFPPHAGGLEDGFFHGLAHRLLEAGSSRGAAFPSSHVGVAVAQVIVVARVAPRFALLLAALAGALAAGAVYGGFHYAIDAVAGALLGGAAALAAPALYRRLRRMERPSPVP
jgi:membrane-associated phospholipid phosphatase